MRILIADDDDVSRLELEAVLRRRGYDVTDVPDGAEAWDIFQQPDPPPVAILDWMMDGMDGVDVCRKVRAQARLRGVYLILLTARGGKEHILEGLEAGANDYLTKPFDRAELLARVRVGEQVVKLQAELAARILELEDAMSQVKQLQGLLPICSYCKNIRDDKNDWHKMEKYVAERTDANFSHGICPACWAAEVAPQLSKAGGAGKHVCVPYPG